MGLWYRWSLSYNSSTLVPTSTSPPAAPTPTFNPAPTATELCGDMIILIWQCLMRVSWYWVEQIFLIHLIYWILIVFNNCVPSIKFDKKEIFAKLCYTIIFCTYHSTIAKNANLNISFYILNICYPIFFKVGLKMWYFDIIVIHSPAHCTQYIAL